MERRAFIGAIAGSVAAGSVAGLASEIPTSVIVKTPGTWRGDMLYRPLGSTKQEVSVLGLGGHHIGRQKDEKDSITIIRTAIDAGVNFMDNSWDYHDGGSEIRMGKALLDGYRKKVFLMTKIDGRTKKACAEQIDESLRRLQTDVIDLMQHHELIRVDDPDRIFAEGGAQEAMVAAQKAGKIRFIGFTGHKDPFIHLRTLEVAKAHGFTFDAVQMPLNVFDAHFRSFAKDVLPVLVKENIGVLGMKSMAAGHIVTTKTATAVECLHYAMTLRTSTVIRGIDSLAILKQDLDAVKNFEPLTEDQMTALLDRTKKMAMTGNHEQFKTTVAYDATITHPEWLGQPEMPLN